MPAYSDEIVNDLFTKMEILIPPDLYPARVIPLTKRITGTAFFPGGRGLYSEEQEANVIEFPFGGVMVIGHNFDSESGFAKSFQQGKENLNRGTWLNLLRLFDHASIPPNKCFFTNAFMGLCQGTKNTDYKGRGDEVFRKVCASFLKAQLGVQKPRLIVTLGLKVPPLLATITSDLGPWLGKLKRGSFDPELNTKDINLNPILNAGFELGNGPKHDAVVIPITHPGEGRNLKLRHPVGFSPGLDGEIELLREGWKLSQTV